MKSLLHRATLYLLSYLGRLVLSLRYWVTIRGLKGLKKYRFNSKKGTIFLANHPAEIDPPLLFAYLWPHYKIRFVASEFVLYTPLVRTFSKLVNVIPIPAFDQTSNSFKQRCSEKALEACVRALENGENICIYPAGMLKRQPEEKVAGTSGIHEILQRVPDANIVLVRITGLWGSIFSTALCGKAPDLLPVYIQGVKIALKNLLFFSPRRKVLVECEPAPEDFPRKGERKEINEFLEGWYNRHGPEPIKLISYSSFRQDLPYVTKPPRERPSDLEAIPVEIRTHVMNEVAKFLNISPENLSPEMDFAIDLGMDSLDRAQLALILKEQFGVDNVPSSELKTLHTMMAYAAQVKTTRHHQEGLKTKGPSKWLEQRQRPLPLLLGKGENLLEMLLEKSRRHASQLIAADEMAGELTYSKVRLGVIAMTEYIKKLPGERVGILLPASVGVNLLIFATMLAGKVPVMINWTLGERNLKAIAEKTGIQATISSWKFLDRLSNIELGPLNDQIITAEEIRYSISPFSKIKAFVLSKLPTDWVMRFYGAHRLKEDDIAVILFTSGTESTPKGVPLSHKNILSNLKGGMPLFDFQPQDVLIGVLPPFHSFGFSVTGIFPFISGLRVAYTPNPTNGRQIARAIERWKGTIFCSAPTFLKNLLKVAKKKQLKNLRLVVTGAEKTGEEIFEKMKEICPQSQILEGYGITECSPILSVNLPDKPITGVGRALPNVEIRVVNPETLKTLSTGETGLIVARGPNVFNGYLGQESSNPFLEIDDLLWYNTGDLGSFDKRGYLTIRGRLKRFVKIGGEMISLPAIEDLLLQEGEKQGWKIDPEIPSLAVIAKEDENEKTTLHLFTTFPATVKEVNTLLREQGFSNLVKIHSVVQRFTIPLLGTGKVDYKELKKLLTQE